MNKAKKILALIIKILVVFIFIFILTIQIRTCLEDDKGILIATNELSK